MYKQLEEIIRKPNPFAVYTADALWTDKHRAEQMLSYHLNESIDLSSRNAGFIDKSVGWITEQVQLNENKTVCDFGCGPGLYTSRLAKTRAKVTGIDFSTNSIVYAKNYAAKHNLDIHYINQNYLDYKGNCKFDLITMIMCDFCALSPAQRKSLLNIFFTSLKTNGKVLLDVYSLAAYEEREEATTFTRNQLNQFWSADDYFVFVNTFKYEDEKVVLDKHSIIYDSDEIETVYNWLQYFSPDKLQEELVEAGFALTAVYSDVAGGEYSEDKPEFAVVAEKKE